MPEKIENIIYDTMRQMKDNSKLLCDLVNKHGSDEHKEAYTNVVYAPVMRLSLILSAEAIDRNKIRHEEISRQVKDYLNINNITGE